MTQDNIDIFLITGAVVSIPIREHEELADVIEATIPDPSAWFSGLDHQNGFVQINCGQILYTRITGPRVEALAAEQLAAKQNR